MSNTSAPIKLGIIGAGIFAREAHLPALLALGETFHITAIASRTMQSAQMMAGLAPYPVDAYDNVAAMLARPEIEAVDIVVPILTLPQAIELALAAGKHVISEKPVAPDVVTGRGLLATHARHPQQLWMIAENVRYEATNVQAMQLIQGGEIGRPQVCSIVTHALLAPGTKYFGTLWRRDGSINGGELLDGGIHSIALMRFLLGDVIEASAVVAQLRPDLLPYDTLSASLRFANGAIGSHLMTFGAASPWPRTIQMIGDQGALRIYGQELELRHGEETRRFAFPFEPGVRQDVRSELAAFAAALRQGEPQRNPPIEALRDLALYEAMLRSAETGQRQTPEIIMA